VGVNPSWVEAFIRHPDGFRDYLTGLRRGMARVIHPDTSSSLPTEVNSRLGEINTAFDTLLGLTDEKLVLAMEQYVSFATLPSSELIAAYSSMKRERDTAMEEADRARNQTTTLSEQLQRAGEVEHQLLLKLFALPWREPSEILERGGTRLSMRQLKGRFFNSNGVSVTLEKDTRWVAEVTLCHVNNEGTLYARTLEQTFTRQSGVADASRKLTSKLRETKQQWTADPSAFEPYNRGVVIGLVSTQISDVRRGAGKHIFPPYLPHTSSFQILEVGRRQLLESCSEYLEQETIFYREIPTEAGQPISPDHNVAVVAVGQETQNGVMVTVGYIDDFIY
jgi:hypothetical protein